MTQCLHFWRTYCQEKIISQNRKWMGGLDPNHMATVTDNMKEMQTEDLPTADKGLWLKLKPTWKQAKKIATNNL